MAGAKRLGRRRHGELADLQEAPGAVSAHMLGTCTTWYRVVAAGCACLLKCRSFYFSGMERSAYQETIGIKKIVCYIHKSKRKGHTGKYQCGSRGMGCRGESWASALIVASMGRNGQGRAHSSGLPSLDHFSRLWSTGAIPNHLAPSPGRLRQGDGG